MGKAYGPTIKKLQRAINDKYDYHLLVNKTQFYSEDANRVLEYISIKRAVFDVEKNKNRNIELFSSASDVQIVLYLRDLWYELNGWEVPTDNEKWNKAKEKYMEKHANG